MNQDLENNKKRYIIRFEKFSILRDKIDSIDNLDEFLSIKDVIFEENKSYSVFGRIKIIKKHSNIIFISLGNDSQLSVNKENILFKDIGKLIIGDLIWVKGKCYKTHTNRITLNIESIERISLNIYTLQNIYYQSDSFNKGKKNYTLQRILSDDEFQMVIVRSYILSSLRNSLLAKDFIETHTSILNLNECGSMAEQFVTFSNQENKKIYLRIAQEIHLKRLVISGVNKVFELGPNFRNEGHSPNHFNEFYTLEAYITNKQYRDAANLVVELINNILQTDCKNLKKIFKYDRLEPIFINMIDLFEFHSKLTYQQFISKDFDVKNFCEIHQLCLQEDKWLIMLEFAEKYIPNGLVVLEKLPISATILAKSIDQYVSESCDIYLDKVEIATVFTENTNPIDQYNKLIKNGNFSGEEFLKDMYLGMPALAGFGIGIERLIKQLTGKAHIRDSYMFLY